MKTILALLLAGVLMVPALAFGTSMDDLEKKIQELNEQINDLQDQIDKNTMHSATDRISFYGDLRAKGDSLHYKDLTNVQPAFVNDPGTGLLVPNFNPDGTLKRKTDDFDNNLLYTTRLRLGMKAKVARNVKFHGRLLMYKNWGDSTGVKVFDSWNSFTMDGTNSGNTTGDFLRVERAYFSWSDIGHSNFYLSIGRRPSTYGPPTNIRENEMRGGTPSGHLVNFNFDGITVGYKLGKVTGWDGQVVRFCYGQGYESEFGNGELFNEIDLEDTHLGGFNIDLLNDGTNFIQLTLFGAKDITDGFKGVLAVPNSFLPASFQAAIFPGFNMLTRVQATHNIGDELLGGIGFMREEDNGIKWFTSLGWTRTDPNGEAGLFGGLNKDAEMIPVDANGNPATIGVDAVAFAPTGRTLDDNAENGYSIYAGIQIPAPMGKLGLEYNYGSKYWLPFTQAQDDIVGSKLSTRGHVGEAYYIVDVNPRMFMKFGIIYYDYEYTGSGAPVGEPKKIDDVKDGKAYSMLPAIDKVYDINASITVKF
ncbi:DUF3373 family protein [Geothermobacter hydrogeniphilus]|uniref:DUF3373 domain-containing protein n=1 Tax=Geothermobacter hydrogeniphilus TaxID=1969733 RepID=A0A1X0Y0G3_9BACT|nr:DUF3373 family protein [Geothermobacter hydrogeniphilus]ORJ58562.1 hypothetical protein B5V00_11985 [Geothermobacter hydrogeniphilus]